MSVRLALCGSLSLALAGCTGGMLGQSEPAAPLSEAAVASEGEPLAPFEPLPAASYATKVKSLLVGSAPTEAELSAATANPNAMRALVATWMATPAYRINLQNFFADAFQQSLAQSSEFVAVIGDGSTVPSPDLITNFRESFARTMLALGDEGQPFTQAASTQRFMMTTAMLSYFAFVDTSRTDDQGRTTNRFASANPNWSMKIQAAAGPVSTAAAASAASGHFMTFYDPNLVSSFNDPQNTGQTLSTCMAADPLIYQRTTNDLNGGAQILYRIMNGLDWRVNVAQGGTTVSCYNRGSQPWYKATDYTDWRMVTVSSPTAAAPQDNFFDLETLRTRTSLRVYTPMVGFFTTPAFVSQWSTNTSNLHRVTANQTLIVAFGEQVDGQDTLPLTSPSAVDANHAAAPACFSCHQTLDPLRQFFRQSYSLNFSQQSNQAVIGLPATFAFRGVVASGNGVVDLGSAIASHPKFATAWTLKLCAWANSAPCLVTDPEVQRIAAAFVSSNYSFEALALELFSSPLVTYASRTVSAEGGRQQASISRRRQLCAILNARLGLSDVCDQAHDQVGGFGGVPTLAANLPADAYSRGVSSPLYVTEPDPFSRNNLELLCASLASTTIDSGAAAWATSSDAPGAIERMVGELMGIPAAEAEPPTSILSAHYAAAVAAGKSATIALRSTFVLACTSPAVSGIGL